MTTLSVKLYMCMVNQIQTLLFHYTMVWSCLPLVQKGIFSIQPVFYVPYWISLFSILFLTCFSPLTFGMKKKKRTGFTSSYNPLCDTTRYNKDRKTSIIFPFFTKHIVLFDLECSLCQEIMTSWNQVELVNCFVFGDFECPWVIMQWPSLSDDAMTLTKNAMMFRPITTSQRNHSLFWSSLVSWSENLLQEFCFKFLG